MQAPPRRPDSKLQEIWIPAANHLNRAQRADWAGQIREASVDMTISAAAVANEFLTLGWAEGDAVPPIDQMKLQKLLYYAQAWHLAIKGQPLFDDDIEAWPWGPVVRSIYGRTKVFGRLPIGGRITQPKYDPVTQKALWDEPKVTDAETAAFIKSVWDAHKAFSGVQLSNSTHGPGEPWTLIKAAEGQLNNTPIIPNDLIEQVFKAKLHGGTAQNTAAAN